MKLPFIEKMKLLAYNLKQIRLFMLPKDYDISGYMSLSDVKYCTISNMWLVASCIRSGEKVPKGVVLVGAWITEKEMLQINEWAQTIDAQKVKDNQ